MDLVDRRRVIARGAARALDFALACTRARREGGIVAQYSGGVTRVVVTNARPASKGPEKSVAIPPRQLAAPRSVRTLRHKGRRA